MEHIVDACTEIWTALSKVDVEEMSGTLPADLRQRARNWVKRISVRLDDSRYREFLATGLSPVAVPDVWAGNPSDAAELEESFLDSVRFELNRLKPRSLLARRLSDDEYRGFVNDNAGLRKALIQHGDSLFLPTEGNEEDLSEWD